MKWNFSDLVPVFVDILLLITCDGAINKNVKQKDLQLNIAYGGVLNDYEQNILPNDTNVELVAKFAINFIKDRYPATVPRPEDYASDVLPYRIKDVQKLNLVFTMDGKKPHLVQMMSADLQLQTHALVWGSTYQFKIIWPNGATDFYHSFTVTEYWDDSLHIYQHTFYKMHANIYQNHLSGDAAKVFQQPMNLPLHQKELSGTVDLEIKSGQEHSEHFSYRSPTGHKKERDTCSKESCDNTDSNQEATGDVNIQLKILSFNIWNTNVVQGGYKQYVRRIKQIAKLAKDSGADIIGFQEVRFEDGKGGRQGPNQVEHLAKILKQYQFVFQPAQIQTSNLPHRVEEGIAFFSKYPVVDHDYLLLSRDYADVADGHQRILLHIEVDVPQVGSVHLFNTHLSLSHVARQRTVREMWKQINQFSGPAFLMGDFNAEAHNKEVKYLDGREDIAGERTSGFNDVWLLQYGTSDPGFTFNTLEDSLTKRIDLIFMRKLSHVTLHNVSLLDDGKRREQAASDHLGLVATFNITALQNAGS